MNAPARFFDKILTFAGDEIRPEYKLTGYKLSDDRRKIRFTDGFQAGEFDLWCSQKTLVYYSDQQIRRVRVVRRADGYYCQFLIDVERREYHKPTGQITGIDLGLKEFYTDAQGNTVENPRYLSKSEPRPFDVAQGQRYCWANRNRPKCLGRVRPLDS
jgi:putative transposase